jgi:hypothetical protein
LRDLRRLAAAEIGPSPAENQLNSSDRSRRIRDAVESALSDVILLGTEEQVRFAAHAAAELAAGRPVQTADLVVSLRNFIRQVLDLDVVPVNVIIPKQGPTRSIGSKSVKEDRAQGDNKQSGKNLGAAGFSGGVGIGGEDKADNSSELHHDV